MTGRMLFVLLVASVVAALFFVLSGRLGCPAGYALAEDGTCVPADYWDGGP